MTRRTSKHIKWFDAGTKKMCVSTFGNFIKLIKMQCTGSWRLMGLTAGQTAKGLQASSFCTTGTIWIIKLKVDWAKLGQAGIFFGRFAISKSRVIAWICILFCMILNHGTVYCLIETRFQSSEYTKKISFSLNNLKTTQVLNCYIYI